MTLNQIPPPPLYAGSLATAAIADDPGDVWKAKCTGSHGDAGKAKTKVGEKEKIPDFTTEKWQKEMGDADIKKVIQDGSDANSKMKPFKEKLSEQEIDGLVKYIRGMKGK
jgi:hypothetical protein